MKCFFFAQNSFLLKQDFLLNPSFQVAGIAKTILLLRKGPEEPSNLPASLQRKGPEEPRRWPAWLLRKGPEEPRCLLESLQRKGL